MRASRVSCVIPTRGDHDLGEILDSLPAFADVIVWDNSRVARDLGLYGRYQAIGDARRRVIVTQDDDLVVTCWDEILAAYQPGVLTVNYPEPWDIPWVARGAIFDLELPFAAFTRYLRWYPHDELFWRRGCDAVFALLTPHHVIDCGSRDLDYCNDPGRISSNGSWYTEDRPLLKERCAILRAEEN